MRSHTMLYKFPYLNKRIRKGNNHAAPNNNLHVKFKLSVNFRIHKFERRLHGKSRSEYNGIENPVRKDCADHHAYRNSNDHPENNPAQFLKMIPNGHLDIT